MLGKYSYHQIIRKTITAFGTLFNDIYIRHQDSDNASTFSEIKVPIAYGPIQKYLARLEEKPDLRNRTAITLPRMSFEIGQLSYDSSRKSSSIQTFNAMSGSNPVKLFMPVPYNLPISLTIAAKYNDDLLQIIEQILPYFKPEFTITVDLVSSIGEKRDIPIVLQSISPFDDNYEGNYTTRRFIQTTLTFVAKIFFFGPVPSDDGGNIIKKVQVDYYSDTNRVNASRNSRYVVTPRAIKDYDEDATTFIIQDINESVTTFEVNDSTALEKDTYINIGDELMYIKSIDGDILTVLRGQDGTQSSSHQNNDLVNVITEADNELIEPGDDFGFDEDRFFFDDGKVYSPRLNTDI
jgi:hypothetical protein